MCQIIVCTSCICKVLMDSEWVRNVVSCIWYYLSCKPCRQTPDVEAAEGTTANLNNDNNFDSEIEMVTYNVTETEVTPPDEEEEEEEEFVERNILVHFTLPSTLPVILETASNEDSNSVDGGLSDGEAGRVPPRGRPSRREDPRRHTLAGNHLYLHPHHPNQINSLELERNAPVTTAKNMPEYATVTKYRDVNQKMLDPRMRKHPLQRNYPPTNNALLFEDDPGVMSEVETASTGFRRGGKQRSSLPVVRTPSKTLERPLGLVFLQYRNETKRALLPNEITSIDTVKALFVRSFPKQLTMQYMESPMVKIYIHDSSKDMFYELEDVRAVLRSISCALYGVQWENCISIYRVLGIAVRDVPVYGIRFESYLCVKHV
ncbi:Coiled-coil domain-containing protein CG32809 [Papilio machaon]|uniref:Coiled-coil domain-containing protein CG32809 n=1 Tax=Papilio machaon TaxID=76193 RepID=A0A194QXN3_PAPMA|nr:Coiled-coil domain-containing protein CG32809 [Papilio machaon]